MTDLSLILIIIFILFLVFLFGRSYFALKVCAICSAVFVTWFGLFLFSLDPVLTGILMGGSAVGLMYLLKDEYGIFKLPLYLTLVSGTYFLLERSLDWSATIIILSIWFIFGTLFTWRKSNRFRKISMKVIECCKNW